MEQVQGVKSKSTLRKIHAKRLKEWTKRIEDFYKNTTNLNNVYRTSKSIITLDKLALGDYGYEIEKDPEKPDKPLIWHDSATNVNTFYCKLVCVKHTKSGKERRVLCRLVNFDVRTRSIREGIHLQAIFGQADELQKAPFFLSIYHTLIDSPQKCLYVMHSILPPSSLAHKLLNFDVPLKRAIKWTIQLARAAEWLNLSGVAHRFIRLENVLLDANNHIRLAGFDVACRFAKFKSSPESPQIELLPKGMGLPEYIPRQMWDHLPSECFDEQYNPYMVDAWSIGVVLCTLLTASHPFDVKQPKTLVQQWRQSAERAALPFKATEYPLGTFLDDIFQPRDQRMSTFDMSQQEERLLAIPKSKVKASQEESKSAPYYRIDMHRSGPPPEIAVAPSSNPLEAFKYSEQSLEIYDYCHYHREKYTPLASEADLQANGTKYMLLRNHSFADLHELFPNEPFIAVVAFEVDKEPQAYLAKIFLYNRIFPSYRSLLLGESCMIIRFLGAQNLVPALLRVVDIFIMKQEKGKSKLKAEKLYIIFKNELKASKSLCQLTAEGTFTDLEQLDDIMHQLADTVDKLISLCLAHRYLRPEHIYLTPNGNIKVTHLEMMCFTWNPKEHHQSLRTKGLHDNQDQYWDHLPPECFLERYDSQLLDVWSFGVCLVYCLTRQMPFTVPHTTEEAISTWKRFKDNHKSSLAPYLDLLERIFQPAEKRIHSDELAKVFRERLFASSQAKLANLKVGS